MLGGGRPPPPPWWGPTIAKRLSLLRCYAIRRDGSQSIFDSDAGIDGKPSGFEICGRRGPDPPPLDVWEGVRTLHPPSSAGSKVLILAHSAGK